MPDLRIGCVADDFTGASDMASFLVKGGLNTEMIDGIPFEEWRPARETQAIVIALKSRTQAVDEAVRDSLACFRWLRNQLGARQLFYKYCSTFDSTDEGNIGPVTDAVLQEFGIPSALVSPALPVNGRTVHHGYLFVNGRLLHESSMRNHPLTPMNRSNLGELIEAQGQGRAVNLSYGVLEQGVPAIREWCERQSGAAYIIADHFNDRHAVLLASSFAEAPFITGSSGLAEALARVHARKSDQGLENVTLSIGQGQTLVLAGSCSEATRKQVDRFTELFSGFRLDPDRLQDNDDYIETVWRWIKSQHPRPCLVYSSEDPRSVRRNQQLFGPHVAERLEEVFAGLARRAVADSFNRVVVAGGETSGAVTRALGQTRFRVGPSIAPGVPVIQPWDMPDLLVALKSGNFGGVDFFLDAVKLMNQETVGEQAT